MIDLFYIHMFVHFVNSFGFEKPKATTVRAKQIELPTFTLALC